MSKYIKAHVRRLHIGAFKKYFGSDTDSMIDCDERQYVEVLDEALLNEPDIIACVQQGLISIVDSIEEETVEEVEVTESETETEDEESSTTAPSDETKVDETPATGSEDSSVDTTAATSPIPGEKPEDGKESDLASAGQNAPDASGQQTPFEDQLIEIDKLSVAKAKDAIEKMNDKDYLKFIQQHASKAGTKNAAEDRLKELG